MNDKFPLEADGGEPMTKGTERLLVHPRSTEGQVRPEPTAYDWADNLELSHDRLLTLYQVDPDHCFHEPPKLLLEEFDSTRDLDNLEPGGSVWLYPEDLPRVIEWLQRWLEAFRDCKESDSRKSPAPYWGDLDGSEEGQGAVE